MRRIALATAVAALLLGTTVAQAATYDAYSSFDGTGSAGTFSFGTDAGTFTNTQANCAGNANFLCAASASGALVPGVGKVLGGGSATFGTVTVPSGTLWVHPGTDTQTQIVFTAPTAGEYSFTATFGRLDTTSNGNGVSVGVGTLTGSLPATSSFGANDLVLSSTDPLALAQGQTLTLFVNNNGDYSYDSTAVDFSVMSVGAVSAAPEPGAWALMLGGVGAMGLMLRRRRTTALTA